MINFGPWLPDQPPLNSPGVTVATNVIPASTGYRSAKSFVDFSNAASNRIRGVFAAKDTDGNAFLFAGDQGKLYRYAQSDKDLDDVSKAGSPAYDLGNSGTTTGDERWRFVQFGSTVIAAGGIGEELQKWTLGADNAFSDLSGTPPKADFIAVVRDQVWTANIDEGSGRQPFRVRWSGINDETSWTTGTDQSDFQDIFGGDSGAITGLIGGQQATIMLERGIAVAYYVGSPLIYQIDLVETSRGCPYPNSIASVGNNVFYLARDGFFMFDGRQSKPIGASKVDDFFNKDFNSAKLDKVSCAVDPINQIVAWSYVSSDNVSDTPDKLIVYNYAIGNWSLLNVSTELLAPIATASVTTEDLDTQASNLDSLVGTLDSTSFKGGTYFFGGAADSKIKSFSGSALAATIETSEVTVNSGRHSVVTKTVPYFKDGTVNMQVGVRDRQDEAVTFSSTSALTDDGFCLHRDQGRFHRFRMNISGEWDFAQGVDVEGRALGQR